MKRTLLLTAAGAVFLAAAAGASARGAAAAGAVPGSTHQGGTRNIQTLDGVQAQTTDVLYSQNDNDTGVGVVSQNFEPDFDVYDSQLADDFVVPDPRHPWQITGITVTGVYFSGSGPATSENVTFYKDSNGVPGEIKNAQTVVGADSNGSFTIPLDKFALPPGHYWVSVQANMDFSSGGEWGWETRSVQNGDAALWENPGNGFGTGCTSWTNMSACVDAGAGPDVMFSLSGRVLGAP